MSAPNPPLPPHGQPMMPPPPQGQPYGQPQGQPYGGQPMPPQGQPYGQPMMPPQGQPVPGPPPGQLPPPPGQGQWPQAAPAKPKRGFPRWLLSLVILIVLGGGFYAFQYFTSDVAQAKAGDCANVTGTTTKPDYKAVPCDSADANYKVGKTLSSTSASCGSKNYDEFTQTARRGPDTKLCLIPNWLEGNCYEMDDTSTTMGYPKIDCGKPKAVKIVKVINKLDERACDKATVPATWPEPATTMCLGAPN